jgi:hypothetical protein
MERTNQRDIDMALRIVGAEDLSDDGEHGTVTLRGHFASAILDVMYKSKERRDMFKNDDVRLFRSGRLEINVDGDYWEGSAVRSVIHKAARSIGHQRVFSIKDIPMGATFLSTRWLQVA